MTIFRYNLSRFMICWPDVLAQEDPYPLQWNNPANYSNTPGDPGGATMDGIVQTEYNAYRAAQNLPIQSVRLISQPEGEAIYLNSYWLPNCPYCPPGLDLCLFDASVNMGPIQGIRIMQVAVQVTEDGIWGPITAAAVTAAAANPAPIVAAYTSRRELVYRTFGEFPEFGNDWIRRAATIGSEAENMAQGTLTMRRGGHHKTVKAPTWFSWHDGPKGV